MKAFIFVFLLSLALSGTGQQKKDSIIINDSWQMADTTQSVNTLKDSLPGKIEMKIINSSPNTSGKSEVINISDDRHSFELNILGRKGYKKSRSGSEDRQYKRFSGHWCGFYYGFTNFAQPDYSIYSPETNDFMELNWSQSFTMQFNLFEQSINLVPKNNFGFVTGIGLEYKRFRFENKHVSIEENDNGVIVPVELASLGITHVKRNSFKILYLTIPLLLEYQFPVFSTKKLYVSGGVLGGVRLHSKTKVVYNDTEGKKHKLKNSDSFNLIPFKADVIAKVGYRNLNVWGSYTLTKMFKADKGPELRPYTVGIGLSF